MKKILYEGLFAGKQVSMTITDMAKEFNRTNDFICRHKKIAEDKGVKDIISYVCTKSNTLRRNEKSIPHVGKRMGQSKGKRVYKEDKFVFDNKDLFRAFLLPVNSDVEIKREDYE